MTVLIPIRSFPRRGLGQNSADSYASDLYDFFLGPISIPKVIVGYEVLTGNPIYSALPGVQTGTSLTANATGTASNAQKAFLIQQETNTLVQAGMDPTEAAAKAQQDVTGQLMQAGTDPSQSSLAGIPGASYLFDVSGGAPSSGIPWYWWAIGAVAAVAGVYVVAKVL